MQYVRQQISVMHVSGTKSRSSTISSFSTLQYPANARNTDETQYAPGTIHLRESPVIINECIASADATAALACI